MKVPPIRPASTVMLVRAAGSEGAFEVLMLRRSAKSVFAPDAYVFPGGTLEPQDSSKEVLGRVDGLGDERLARMFRTLPTPLLDSPAISPIGFGERAALVVAALRELFEESGILLGVSPTASLDPQALQAARMPLLRGARTFGEVLGDLDLRLDASRVELFSEWITPPSEVRRFDAHFFVARAGMQTAAADRHETHDEVWIEPRVAFQQYQAGSFAMVYPTIKHIERLIAFRTVNELMVFAQEKTILRIMPNVSAANGFALPHELEGAW